MISIAFEKPSRKAIVVLRDKYVRSHPAHDDRAAVALEPWDTFTRLWTTDAHFAAYGPATAPARRLSTDSLTMLEAPPVMKLIVVDVDGPGHERGPTWDEEMRARISHLPGSPFGFFTRGGARLVYEIDDTPLLDADAWSRTYLLALVSIAATSGIVADATCCDWPRLHRAPHAKRDGVVQAHGWLCGSPMSIGAWPEPKLTDAEILSTLGYLEAHSREWRTRAHRFSPSPPSIGDSVEQQGAQAIAWAAKKVASAEKGQRNAELYRRTRWLADLVVRGEVDDRGLADSMIRAAVAAGLTAREARQTIASAMRGRR